MKTKITLTFSESSLRGSPDDGSHDMTVVTTPNKRFLPSGSGVSLGIFPVNLYLKLPCAIFLREDLLSLKATNFLIDFSAIEANDVNTFLFEWKEGRREVERDQLMIVFKLSQEEVLMELDVSVLYSKALHEHSILNSYAKSSC